MSDAINITTIIDDKENLPEQVSSLLSSFNHLDRINLAIAPFRNFVFSNISFPETPGHISVVTSGTSGEPKTYWKSYKGILENKKGKANYGEKWLLTYNPGRWAGLSVITHCIKNHLNLIVPQSLSPLDIIYSFPSATHVSLTPSFLRKLMIIDAEALKLAPIVQVTFGGEWADQKIIDQAKSIWNNARITCIYASSELGDICSSSDGQEGFSVNKIPGSQLDESGQLFINDFPTGDLWRIENERYIFKGRLTEIINIGGAKITQTEIEQKANSVEGVLASRSFPHPNPLLGQVVGLEYVGNISERDLKNSLRNILPRYAVPVLIKKVSFINLSQAGKIERK